MRVSRTFTAAALLTLLPLAAVSARGVGGFSWGEQYFASDLANVDIALTTSGIYGYTVTGGGQRYGGFALGLHSDRTSPTLNGGFIGGIAGQEVRVGPATVAATAWTGFGGMSMDPLAGTTGTFALFGELALEAGFGFLPGVQVTGYAALQGIAQVRPERVSLSSAVYTPVIGLRVAWGS